MSRHLKARCVMWRSCLASIAAALLFCAAAAWGQTSAIDPAKKTSGPPTVAEAQRFMDLAEARLKDADIKAMRASWVSETYITDDTEAISADADKNAEAVTHELIDKAKQFDKLQLPPKLRRKFDILKLSLDIPSPSNPAAQAELSKILVSLDSDYGKGTWCPDANKDNCKQLPDIEKIIASSRDPKELLAAWLGWHAIAPPMRDRYARMVTLGNQGARDLGFADMSVLWRSHYEMSPDDFSKEMDRLWDQVRPLYDSLHTYVRWKLAEKYGKDVVSEDGPIPADLLGDMWAQSWTNIYPLVAPPNDNSGIDVAPELRAKNIDAKGMVRYGEAFFVSLGFPQLPASFWENSMFTKPRDRDVVCHASAEDLDFKDDVRIKMCIDFDEQSFEDLHHELGHDYYFLAYNRLSPLFQDGANEGFQEAIGDTIQLSVTPDYLKKIGLIDRVPPESADIGVLLNRALDKVAFLPFGLLVDQWRWGVFSGKIKPADYNKAWWDLRRKYQGVAPPVPRSEADFDPGAKYHIASNTPYARYFLAMILEFQFHRALCKEAGYTGPLNRCSIYGNKAAGAKLAKVLAMGQIRPWPEALEAMTGSRQMDASAMLDYFGPLKKWLDEQNRGHKVGWN